MNFENREDRALKLLLAVGDIDDKLVEDAKKPYPIFFTIKRTIALVASLILVMVISISAIALAPVIFDGANSAAPGGSADAPSQSPSRPDGGDGVDSTGSLISKDVSVPYGTASSIAMVDNASSRYSFLVNIGDDIEKIELYIFGYTIDESGTLTKVVATTVQDVPDGYTRISLPKLLVSTSGMNESEVNAIPTAHGSYVLSFDLSSYKANGFIVESISISPFASFNPN